MKPLARATQVDLKLISIEHKFNKNQIAGYLLLFV